MRNAVNVITLCALIAGAGFFAYRAYLDHSHATQIPLTPTPADAAANPSATSTPSSSDSPAPVPLSTGAEPLPPNNTTQEFPAPEATIVLPPLAASDTELVAALTELAGDESYQSWFALDAVAKNMVVSIDNLSGGKLAVKHRLLKPWSGSFAVNHEGEDMVLADANYMRYTPLVKFVTGLDPVAVGHVYAKFYPLLQQAYEELGYPEKQFHARLLAVIDHLLAIEPLAAPIKLLQPKVFYQFADPELEAASPGAKILYRIGAENAAAIQSWLSRVRAALSPPN